MLIICFNRFDFISKVIEYGVHHIILTKQLDLCVLAVKKLKSLLGEIADAVLFWLWYGLFFQNRGHFVNAVYTECSNLTMFV